MFIQKPFLLLSTSICLMACSGEKSTPETFEPGDAESDEILDEDDFTGLFAVKQSSSERLKDPFGGSDWEIIQSVNLNLVEISREAKEVSMLETNCATRVSPVFGATTQIPSAYLESTSGKTRVGNLSALTVGAAFNIDTFIDTNGVILSNPETEEMPTSEDDVRIIDQDNDGHPGLTVDVVLSFTTGQVYVAQRVAKSYSGVVINPNRIEGGLTYLNEQITLGASSIFFGGDQIREPDDSEDLNWFILQKVNPEVDCSSLIADENLIFGD